LGKVGMGDSPFSDDESTEDFVVERDRLLDKGLRLRTVSKGLNRTGAESVIAGALAGTRGGTSSFESSAGDGDGVRAGSGERAMDGELNKPS